MSMNKAWMYNRLEKGILRNEFIDELDKFVNFAKSHPECMDGALLRCPCNHCKCRNKAYRDEDTVKLHILKKGFVPNYYNWYCHGEPYSYEPIEPSGGSSFATNVIEEASVHDIPMQSMVQDALNAGNFPSYSEEIPTREYQHLYEMLQASEREVWSGIPSGHSQLSATARLLNMKAEHHFSERCYDDICQLMSELLPDDNCMTDSFYSTKKLVRGLGLPVQKIHCERRYKDFIYELRKKEKKPSYVDPAIWDAWTSTWGDENWKAKAAKARANRHTESFARHTSGSRSIVEHAQDLERDLQRQPTSLEIFLKTHKKKDGSFVDDRSRSIHENITNKMAEASQPAVEGGDPQLLDSQAINDMYYEAVGGRIKDSTVYGLGSQARVTYDRLRTPRRRDSSSSSSSSQNETLRRETEDLRTRLGGCETRLESQDWLISEQQKKNEEQQKKYEEQQKQNEAMFENMRQFMAGFAPSQVPETQDPRDPGCS